MSTTRSQGVGFQPSILARRDVLSLLASQRQLGESVRPAIYVSNAGNDVHFVKNQCNDQPYPVTGAVKGQSFAEGTQVTLLSNAGNPGELLLGEGAQGRAGSSGNQAVRSIRTVGHGVRSGGSGACPVGLTARLYYGVFGVAGQLQAATYVDGHYQEIVAETDSPGGGGYCWQRVTDDILVATSGFDFDATQVWCWRLSDNTLSVATLAGIYPGSASGPIAVGGYVYFWTLKDGEIQLYRLPLMTNEDLDDSFKFGPPYPLAPGVEVSGGWWCQAAGWFDFGATVGVPYYNGGWHSGAGRALLTPDFGGNSFSPDSRQLGFPVQGGSLRVVVVPGVLKRAEDENSLVPPDWTTVVSYGFIAPSPSGREYACYPASTSEGPDRLMRYPIGTRPITRTGCPVPSQAVETSPDGWLPICMLPRDH